MRAKLCSCCKKIIATEQIEDKNVFWFLLVETASAMAIKMTSRQQKKSLKD
jgi:hypothetical protein